MSLNSLVKPFRFTLLRGLYMVCLEMMLLASLYYLEQRADRRSTGTQGAKGPFQALLLSFAHFSGQTPLHKSGKWFIVHAHCQLWAGRSSFLLSPGKPTIHSLFSIKTHKRTFLYCSIIKLKDTLTFKH